MMTARNSFHRSLRSGGLGLSLSLATVGSQANPILNTGATNAQLEVTLAASGVIIEPGSLTILNGDANQFGQFTNGTNASGAGPVIGIDTGVFLATGNANGVDTAPDPDANAVLGPNNYGETSLSTGSIYSDPQLTGLAAAATRDTVVLQLRLTPSQDDLRFAFVYASEEYPEYVCSQFNDVFGFFVKPASAPDVPENWTNAAVIPGTSTPISVNTINSGVCGSEGDGTPSDLSNSALFTANGDGSTPASNQNLQHDGFTVPLSVQTPVIRGAPYDVKLAIGDTVDDGYDAAVFLNFIGSGEPADYSDAPLTGTAYGGALHTVVPGNRLGALNTADLSNYNTVNADGDDDDGVTLPVFTQGAAASISVSATGAGGYLQGWIDWDGDGSFGAGEQIATDLQDNGPGDTNAAVGTIDFSVTPPASAITTQTFARFRWSTTASLDTTSDAADGEVEDYALTVNPAPPPSSGTLSYPDSGNGAYPGSIALLDWGGSGLDDGIREGDSVSFSLPGCRTGTLTATFSNIDNATSAESYVPTDMNTWSGASMYQAYNAPGSGEALYGQGNRDVSFRVNWSMTIGGIPVAPDILVLDAEATNVSGEFINATTNGGVWSLIESVGGTSYTVSGLGTQSFSITQTETPSNSPVLLTENATQTEISIDAGGRQAVAFGVLLPCDYGDANGYAAASHAYEEEPASPDGLQVAAGQLYLGSAPPDSEVSTQGTAASDGDDSDSLGDDEDGVPSFPTLVRGQAATISVSVTEAGGNNGFLQGWIDWDGSGTFDSPVEQIATDLQDTDSDGTILVSVTVPSYATTAPTFARFRWSSDPAVGPDGAIDDGEAEDYALTLGATGPALSGRVFIDNGIGGATAHDAAIGGTEAGSQSAVIELRDSGGGLIDTPTVNGDGTWSYTLPTGLSAPVTVAAVPLPGWVTISEQTTGLPTLVNADPHDGTFTFTPASGTPYPTLDIGLVEEPRLTQSQTANISGGQVVLLRHLYTATTPASVTFSYTDVVMTPVGAFSAALFEDTDCDGTPEASIDAPRAVSEGESVCVISRVAASSGIGPGAQFSYGLAALSAFTTTSKSHAARNDDVITASTGGDELLLQKTVRNETKGTPEGTSNVGDLGDVLEYRLTMSNPSGEPAINVTVKDQTPAYTSLTAPIASPVTVATGVTCSLSVPAVNIAGYAGPLEWSCPGSFPPGGQGELTFRVTISP